MTSDSDAHDNEALKLRAVALFRAGDLAAAAAGFAEAIARDPNDAAAHFSLGVVLERLERVAEAEAHYARAVAIDAGMAKALVNWGNLLRARGDIASARHRYERALAIDASDAHALNNLAGLAYDDGDLASASELYERALAAGNAAARSGFANTKVARAKLLHRSGDYQAAAALYRDAIELSPQLAAAVSGLGSALLELGQPERAIELYREALAKDPRDFEALNNLACVALERGERDEARRLFSAAVQVDPRPAEPRFNLALLALYDHDFQAGWTGYELRQEADAATIGLAPSDLPRLSRLSARDARRVAVRKEQGIGDQILFSTLLPDLRDLGVSPVAEVDPRLLAAYRRSLPGIEFVPPESAASEFATCDHQIPLASLGALLRPTKESFARQPAALLRPDLQRARELASALAAGPKIAIAWRSFQKGRHRRISTRKSAELACFAPFARLGAKLVDLQYGDATAERARFDAQWPGCRVDIPGLDRFNDLDGVMAALELCDLVVTTSNVTAHLAGAIGKQAWLVYLGGHAPFHYWVPGDDSRSLWYPSVEIVTDDRWTTWEAAFDTAARLWSARAG